MKKQQGGRALKEVLGLGWRFLVLTVLYLVVLSVGGALLGSPVDVSLTPDQQGAMALGMVIVAAVHTLVVMAIVLRARWSGWKLMLATGFSFYGVLSVMSGIEVVYFGPAMDIPAEMASAVFLSNLPLAIVWVPLAVLLLGRGRSTTASDEPALRLQMPGGEWAWKMAAIAVIYLAIYFVFGVVVAWRNPDLRAMYGNGANQQVFSVWLLPFQMLRSALWVLFALPVIRMTRGKRWQVALVVMALYSVMHAIGLILPSPSFMPDPGVRLSHLIELLTSNALFGWIVTALLLWRPKRAAEARLRRASPQASG